MCSIRSTTLSSSLDHSDVNHAHDAHSNGEECPCCGSTRAMMSLPPGLRYTLRQLPNILIPPAIVYASAYIAREYFQLIPPTWLLVLLTLFSWPIAFTALVQCHDYANLLRARALGAVIPREISHKWPGSIDVLKRIFALDNVRYLGTYSHYPCRI